MSEGARDLRRLRADWETLGSADPLWAVYVTKEARGGGWDVSEFLATGLREVEESWSRAAQALNHDVPRAAVALDFGCGVGRLTAALASHADHVVGVDISATMLDNASHVIPETARSRVSLVASSSPRLPIRDARVDLVYTSLVLQHMPSSLAKGYISEFMRIMRPGGLAFVQVAEAPDNSLRGRLFRYLPANVYGMLQRKILRYPASMRMEALSLDDVTAAATGGGGRIVGHWSDPSYGGHWSYRRVLIARADR
jgi:SAM-dependent methyltransferase